MNHHILLKDGTACAVDVPDYTKFAYFPKYDESVDSDEMLDIFGTSYGKAKQHAIDNAVPFKDYHEIWAKMYISGLFKNLTTIEQENKLYTCPEGYRIEIKCQHKGIHNSTCIYHAVLKPVER